ncbi:MAG: S41 family peptidase [Fimbriimonadaceae bacterium]
MGIAALSVTLGFFLPAITMQPAPTTPPPTAPAQNRPAAPPPPPITEDQKREVLEGMEKLLFESAFVPGVDFREKWPEFLEKHKEGMEKADTIPAFTTAVNRALREFGFSHIRLQTPTAVQARNNVVRVGIGVTAENRDERLAVTAVAPKGPADLAGIRPGETIITIDGEPAKPDRLLGEMGREVKLGVQSPTGETREVTVRYGRFISATPEVLTWPAPDTAMIRVRTFSGGFNTELINSYFKEVHDKKAKNLILDLRSNGGGSTANLAHLMSFFVPANDVIGTFVNRRTADQFAKETGKEPTDLMEMAEWARSKYRVRKGPLPPFEGRIVVLINRGSASASEITAQALREHREAVIIGLPTAGAVLASQFRPLPHGFNLQVPVSDYVSLKGVRLERNPVRPDHEVAAGRPNEPDPQLAKALEVLGVAPVEEPEDKFFWL